MATKKPQIANKILSDYLINSSHDLKSVGGLVVSGIISTFGVYSLIRPFFTDGEVTNTATLNTALIAFVIVLIIFDTVKRGAFTKYFNSLLKKKIIESKVKRGYLVIAIFATVFMIGLDTLGSWSTAEKGASLYTQFKTNSSTEYQILQQNAENGKIEANNYPLQLEAWKQSKKDAYNTCMEQWKGWKAKYKAKCKKDWNNAHPMPQPTSTGQIKIDDYKNIKEDNQSFLDKYLFTILFILLSLMTLLMQYLTISKIYDDYNDIEESLTFDRISFIQDTIQEHEQILAEHEQQTAELLANAQREKKSKDRKFVEIGEAIAITHKEKRNATRAETVKRIANNTYVPVESSKAGFVDPFPFSSNQPKKEQSEKIDQWKDYKEQLGIENIIDYYNNNGVHYAYLYRGYLVHYTSNSKTQITKPKEGDIQQLGNNPYRSLVDYRPTILKSVDGALPLPDAIELILELRDEAIQPSPTDEDFILEKLFLEEQRKESKKMRRKGDKLTPKSKVIDTSRRREVEALSRVYKKMVNLGIAELRGNKGYYALMDYAEARKLYEEKGGN